MDLLLEVKICTGLSGLDDKLITHFLSKSEATGLLVVVLEAVVVVVVVVVVLVVVTFVVVSLVKCCHLVELHLL